MAVADGVHVKASKRAGAIVVLGDSITDGVGSSVDANRRWPDMLSERLQLRPNLDQLSVLNQGIIGNRLLRPGTGAVAQLLGAAGLARFDRDVVAQSGVRYLIVLLGINDIGAPASEAVTVDELIAGYRQLIERAHQRGITIFGATLPPFEGATIPGFYSAEGEQKRQVINEWIRRAGEYDGVMHGSKVEEFDVEGILNFAERVLPRASDLWIQASLKQRQRLQRLFFSGRRGVQWKSIRSNCRNLFSLRVLTAA